MPGLKLVWTAGLGARPEAGLAALAWMPGLKLV